MISSVSPLYAGNALQIALAPPAGALRWRVLRKAADTFVDQNDPDALVALEGTARSIIDAAPGLKNGTPAFYKAYYFDGSAWSASDTVAGTPQATYDDSSSDALSLLRDRLDAGFGVELARGTFALQGHSWIQVLTAPPVASEVEWPVVTVHLESERPIERALGELVTGDEFDAIGGDWIEHEGWLADVRINVTVWSLNPDERIELRKALRRILVANLAIFDAAGLLEVDFDFSDNDLVNGEFDAPMYQVVCNFSCHAPVVVTNTADPIADVDVTVGADIGPSL